MFSKLNASSHKNNPQIYNEEFINLLSKIVLCYKLLLSDKVQLENDENKIRDVLLINYLNNNAVRKKVRLNNFIFNREVPEDNSAGRTDIKIQTFNSFVETDAYYIIECKRLDNVNLKGVSGLNAEYVKEGIIRFVTGYYSCYYKVNGMIGFIVKQLDINANHSDINYIIKHHYPHSNTKQYLQKENCINNFDFLYSSIHSFGSTNEIKLYHLMLDFSKNIA